MAGFRIPPDLMREFESTVRRIAPGGTKGTKPIDIRVFREALTSTLGTRGAMEVLVNAALKRAQIKIR